MSYDTKVNKFVCNNNKEKHALRVSFCSGRSQITPIFVVLTCSCLLLCSFNCCLIKTILTPRINVKHKCGCTFKIERTYTTPFLA
jgi:hypothetical protein